MNKRQYQDLVDSWIEEIYSGLSPFENSLSEAEQDRIVGERFSGRMAAEAKKNPSEAMLVHSAKVEIERFLWEHRPKGRFNPEAYLPLPRHRSVNMKDAKKEHVAQWYGSMVADIPLAREHDDHYYENRVYAESRLYTWGDHATLLELEQDKFGW